MEKKKFKDKWPFFMVPIIIVILIVIVAIFIFGKKKTDEVERELKENIYTMYVRINPLVKLVYKESHYECIEDGKKNNCGEASEEVVEYELLNSDAKEIYGSDDFVGKTLEDTVTLLIDGAKSNDINTDTVDIISSDQKFDKETFDKNVNGKLEKNVSFDFTIEKDVTEAFVFDKFDIKYYTIKFDSDGGTSIMEQSVISDNNVTMPNPPSKSGYKFVEWQLNNKKYDFSKKVTEDITLKAKWKKVEEKKDNEEDKKTDGADDKKTSSTVDKQEKLVCVAGDAAAPKVDNIKFNPSKITVGKNITATVHITDESGVKDAWVRYDNTTGSVTSTKLKLKSGTLKDGIFTGTVKIPNGQPAGTWTAVVYAGDSCENLEPAKQSIVAEGSIKDNVVPKVEIISISPNPAKVGDKVTVKVKASDASGIKKIDVQLNTRGYTKNNKPTLISGDKYDGVYSTTFDIPSGKVDGDWSISSVATDIYGNDELAHTTIKVTGGSSDNKGPVISLTSISTTNPNRGDTIHLKVKGTDETGIEVLYCGISRTVGSFVSGGNLSLESGTNKDGIYSINIPVPADVEPNTYKISCRTNDTLKNSNYYVNISNITIN